MALRYHFKYCICQPGNPQQPCTTGIISARRQGYKLQTDLLTPYPQSGQLSEPQSYYNDCLSKTQVKVECVIAMMKKKFVYLTMP